MSLSNTELYFADPLKQSGHSISIYDDEFKHVTRVMRHTQGDEIHITNGKGEIYLARIENINSDHLTAGVISSYKYTNRLENIYFCIPKIKNPDRFEFALEKCVELGITKFIVFESERAFKKGIKPERLQRILLSAMKQSLQSYLPTLEYADSFEKLLSANGEKIILEQNASDPLRSINISSGKDFYFIFGPEGGLSPAELNMISKASKFKLTDNRLRSETAIVTCAAILNTL
jgi:16S rRNA (uracil1498-N3)-methyltransferase